MIGMGAVIGEGCIIEEGAIIAAGAVIPPGTRVPTLEVRLPLLPYWSCFFFERIFLLAKSSCIVFSFCCVIYFSTGLAIPPSMFEISPKRSVLISTLSLRSTMTIPANTRRNFFHTPQPTLIWRSYRSEPLRLV
jgi:hypothetical protein